jgi:hypothetical protein
VPGVPGAGAVNLNVRDAVDGGSVNDVIVNGQTCVNINLWCVPRQPDGGSLGLGTFSFDVTAPGYAHVALDVTLPAVDTRYPVHLARQSRPALRR